jgi:hypothetical protein
VAICGGCYFPEDRALHLILHEKWDARLC